jgi:HemY protein
MARTILFLVTVGLVIAAAVWFADRPGEVVVNWQGWRVDTNVPILVLGLLAILFAFSALFRLLVWIFATPRRMVRSRREKRQRKGYLALIDGLSAVAAGDPHQAHKKAKAADSLLKDPPLTMLLSAQAAQLTGDAEAAKKHFAAMLDRPETAFLGLRGLLTQALKEGDQAAALDYARRAHALNPDAPWLTATLFDLQARAGLWREAQDTLAEAERKGVFGADEARRKKAVVLHERAVQAEAAGDRKEAARLLRDAGKADPSFAAAATRLTGLLDADGKKRKAAGVIEDAWRFNATPDLAKAYMALYAGEAPLQRVRQAERLASVHATHPESHLVVAEAALEAKLWGQARNHLTTAAERRPTARVYRMLAQVEEQETGDAEAVRRWLAQAAEAKPEPVWLCRQCGIPATAWSTACPACHGIDTIAWSDPIAPPAPAPLPSLHTEQPSAP